MNTTKTLLFSKLTESGRKYYKENSWSNVTSDANKKINYYNTVEPEYGYLIL